MPGASVTGAGNSRKNVLLFSGRLYSMTWLWGSRFWISSVWPYSPPGRRAAHRQTPPPDLTHNRPIALPRERKLQSMWSIGSVPQPLCQLGGLGNVAATTLHLCHDTATTRQPQLAAASQEYVCAEGGRPGPSCLLPVVHLRHVRRSLQSTPEGWAGRGPGLRYASSSALATHSCAQTI